MFFFRTISCLLVGLVTVNSLPSTYESTRLETEPSSSYTINPPDTESISLEGLDYLLRQATNLLHSPLHYEQQDPKNIENLNEKLLPPNEESYNFYLPLYMYNPDEKFDSKTKQLLKFSPPEKSNEPNYYAVKPKKIPKKYSTEIKHVNIKREAIDSKTSSKSTSTTARPLPQMTYDWIPIVGYNHPSIKKNTNNKKNQEDKSVYDDFYFGVDSHSAVPERDNNKQESELKSTLKTSQTKRDVDDQIGKLIGQTSNDRLEYQMHGFDGPRSYKFGYDTGKGKDRQFRSEERTKDGSVKGQYGYVDEKGQVRVVRYTSNAEIGFQIEQ